MKKFLLLPALLLAGGAYAADVRINCTGPTTYTDGTSIGSAPITYNLYGAQAGQTKAKLASGTSCAFTRTGVLPGTTHEYHVTATVAGVESDPSNTGSISIPLPKPNAPTGTTVITITIQTQ